MSKGSSRGNSLEEQRLLNQMLLDMAQALVRFERIREAREEHGEYLTGIRVRFPDVYGGEYMLVVSGHLDGRYVVGFHSASSLADVLKGGLARIESGGLKWKDDTYKN